MTSFSFRSSLLTLVALGALGCPDAPSTPPDAGIEDTPAPTVTSIDPAEGVASGGVFVTIVGNDFVEGAKVIFGEAGLGGVEATQVTVIGPRRITALSPAGTGTVDVVVENPDGKLGSLSRGFRFVAMQATQISNAVLLGEAERRDVSGLALVAQQVVAEVEVPGVTAGDGQGAGVKAQIGYQLLPIGGSVNLANFSWVTASYVDGGTEGRDRYQGTLQLPGASAGVEKTYVYAARFTLDDGSTWVVADRDGSANGVTTAQLNRVVMAQETITWCKLGGEQVGPAPQVSYLVGQVADVDVFVQIYKAGITDMGAPGPGLVVELGVGPEGTDPRSASGWTWSAAAYNPGFAGEMNNDEYFARLENPGAGTYAFAYRVSIGSGPKRFCDANGTSDTEEFELNQLGVLTVGEPTIESCKLQGPSPISALPGGTSQFVYGRVHVPNVTTGAGAGSGIVGQVGFGAVGSTPSDSWTWTNATYFGDVEPADEHRAQLTAPGSTGTHDVAFRFKLGSGAYVNCDLDGSSSAAPYETAQAGKFNVIAAPAVSDCNLQFVGYPAGGAAGTVPSGEPLVAYGRVNVPGVTESIGQGSGVRAQFGVGTRDTDASSDPAWGWQEASYFGDIPDGRDEYSTQLRPAYNGDRAVSFRVTLNDGATWSYCDVNGNATGGYTADQQWNVTVTDPTSIQFCALESPATLTHTGAQSSTVTGRVYHGGITEAAGAPLGLRAELGFGPEIEDPGVSSKWTWTAATWASQASNDDLFSALLATPVGTFQYAYRFTRDDGVTWCYADVNGNGSNGSFDPALNGFSGRDGTGLNLGEVVTSP